MLSTGTGCAKQNAGLWNLDLSGFQPAGCHNPRAMCEKETATSLTDNLLSFYIERV